MAQGVSGQEWTNISSGRTRIRCNLVLTNVRQSRGAVTNVALDECEIVNAVFVYGSWEGFTHRQSEPL